MALDRHTGSRERAYVEDCCAERRALVACREGQGSGPKRAAYIADWYDGAVAPLSLLTPMV